MAYVLGNTAGGAATGPLTLGTGLSVAGTTITVAGGAPAVWQWAVPVILPGGGSFGNNGALTLTTALPTTFSNGCYLYFPVNAIVTGSAAGVYYAVMSSATVGTVYNNVLTAGNKPVVIASPTAFATTGPGAYTQTISTAIPLITLPITGGSLGPNGVLMMDFVSARPNNADGVTYTATYGGTLVWTLSGISNLWQSQHRLLRNMGVQNAQVSYNPATGSGTTDWQFNTQAPSFLTLDTSTTLNYIFTANIGVSASDYAVILGAALQVNYAP